jgi:hypothetical protein
MKQSLWFILICLAIFVGLLSVMACTRSPSQPSDLAVVNLTLVPASGKAPLTVDVTWSVSKATRCQLIIAGGSPSDVPCRDHVVQVIFASTSFTVLGFNADGIAASRMQVATILP